MTCKTVNEIGKALGTIKNATSPGPGAVNMEILKIRICSSLENVTFLTFTKKSPKETAYEMYDGRASDKRGAEWALAALLQVSRSLGLAPVTLGRGNRPRPSLFWRVFSAGFSLCFIGLVVWHLRICAKVFLRSPLHPALIASFVVLAVQNSAAIIALASSCWDGGAWMQEFFDMLFNVDQRLGTQEYPIHVALRRKTKLILFVLAFILTLLFMLDMINLSTYHYFVYFFANFISDVFICQFVSATILIKHRIIELNNHLTHLNTPCKGKLLDFHSTNQLPMITRNKVNNIAETFTILHEITNNLGMHLGVSLVAQLLQILVGMVGWAFMLLFIFKRMTLEWIAPLVVNVMMPLHSVAQLMWISMESHNVMEQGELTSQLVHRQLLRLQSMQSSSARMIESSWALQQMSLQLLHEHLHVRVAGLLPLDRTLLLGAAGCLFTNVLILLQFATQDFVAPLEDA